MPPYLDHMHVGVHQAVHQQRQQLLQRPLQRGGRRLAAAASWLSDRLLLLLLQGCVLRA